MCEEFTTVEDFVRWERCVKSMSNSELWYAIRDCVKAAEVVQGREGYYHDQASCYRQELARRGQK